jgi:hypothetical protein
MMQDYKAIPPKAKAVEFTGTNKTEILDWVGTMPELYSWSGAMNFRDHNGVLECKWASGGDNSWQPVNVGDVVVLYPGSEGAQAVPGTDFYAQWEPVT